eukprot:TRINITY_DN6958_c0_g1_i1.p1 TRINITY_DN6958_c0_g1~~TRINITY_DN6958_c0_g1_i1.p1  ORF type:complete len:652 (-),score=179.84 TRINITY_DN6958_c0_g1_i1:34-1989(-)
MNCGEHNDIDENLMILGLFYGLLGYEGEYLNIIKVSKNRVKIEMNSNIIDNERYEYFRVNQILKVGSDYLNIQKKLQYLKKEIQSLKRIELKIVLESLSEGISNILESYEKFIVYLQKEYINGNKRYQNINSIGDDLVDFSSILDWIITFFDINFDKVEFFSLHSFVINDLEMIKNNKKGNRVLYNVINELLSKIVQTYILYVFPSFNFSMSTRLPFFLEDNDKTMHENLISLSNYRKYLSKLNVSVEEEDFKVDLLQNLNHFGNFISVDSKQVFEVSKLKITETINNLLSKSITLFNKELFIDRNLISIFSNVQNLFLMGQSDIFSQFIELSFVELNNHYLDIDIKKIEGFFYSCQPNIQDLSRSGKFELKFSKDHFINQITNFDHGVRQKPLIGNIDMRNEIDLQGYLRLFIEWKPLFPYSLIFNDGRIRIYQFLFRFLFRLKYIEFLLNKIWIYDKRTKVLKEKNSNRAFFNFIFILRHNMIQFIHIFMAYIWNDVISIQFYKLLDDFNNNLELSLDEINKLHQSTLQRIMEQSFLLDLNTFKIINKLLNDCEKFYEYSDTFFQSTCIEINDDDDFGVVSENLNSFSKDENFQAVIYTTGRDFMIKLNEFRKLLTEKSSRVKFGDVVFVNLAKRLDLNNFYHDERFVK